MRMADMSQQCTDALIAKLIKSHNRRDIDHVLKNIPTFNGEMCGLGDKNKKCV